MLVEIAEPDAVLPGAALVDACAAGAPEPEAPGSAALDEHAAAARAQPRREARRQIDRMERTPARAASGLRPARMGNEMD